MPASASSPTDVSEADQLIGSQRLISVFLQTVPSTSRLHRRKSKPVKFVSQAEQRWQQATRNWLDLPSDVTANIIQRIGAFDILENAQKVCTTWHKICKDPAMWKVIYMDYSSYPFGKPSFRKMCKECVDRSQDQLVKITVVGFCDDELLQHVADRSSHLRCLEIARSCGSLHKGMSEALKKFSLLEELNLYGTRISIEAIETAGQYCPLLKVLKLNNTRSSILLRSKKDDKFLTACNEIAVAIGKYLPELRHLELIGNIMSNAGLQAILDGCCHLESLDLRRCFFINLNKDAGKRCLENIKKLKLPNDSLEGFLFIDDYTDHPYFDNFEE